MEPTGPMIWVAPPPNRPIDCTVSEAYCEESTIEVLPSIVSAPVRFKVTVLAVESIFLMT